MDAQYYLNLLFGSGVIGSLIAAYLNHRYDSDLQSTIENLKSQLQQNSVEHQVKFTHLHIKRAEILAESYKYLSTLHTKSIHVVAKTSDAQEEEKDAIIESFKREYWNLRNELSTKIIYLPERTAEKTLNFLSFLEIEVFNYTGLAETTDPIRSKLESWESALRTLVYDGQNLLKDIAKDYRNILDYSDQKPKDS